MIEIKFRQARVPFTFIFSRPADFKNGKFDLLAPTLYFVHDINDETRVELSEDGEIKRTGEMITIESWRYFDDAAFNTKVTKTKQEDAFNWLSAACDGFCADYLRANIKS